MASIHRLNVVKDGVWKIRHRRRAFSGYDSKEAATETAVTWAINAVRQGHDVEVVVRPKTGLPRTVWQGCGKD